MPDGPMAFKVTKYQKFTDVAPDAIESSSFKKQTIIFKKQ